MYEISLVQHSSIIWNLCLDCTLKEVLWIRRYQREKRNASMAGEQRAKVPRRLRAITSNWTNSAQLTLTGSIGRPCQPGHTAILSGRHTYDVKKSGSRAKSRFQTLLFTSFPCVVRSKYTSQQERLFPFVCLLSASCVLHICKSLCTLCMYICGLY